MKTRIDWLPALAHFAFGAVFVYASMNVTRSFSGGYGHRMVPLTTSLIVTVLSAVLLVRSYLGSNTAGQSPDTQPLFLRDLITRTAPLLALTALYALFFVWFGYFVSSLLTFIAVLLVFGTTWRLALFHGLVGTVLFYVMFIRVFGLYDPGGTILDLPTLLRGGG